MKTLTTAQTLIEFSMLIPNIPRQVHASEIKDVLTRLTNQEGTAVVHTVERQVVLKFVNEKWDPSKLETFSKDVTLTISLPYENTGLTEEKVFQNYGHASVYYPEQKFSKEENEIIQLYFTECIIASDSKNVAIRPTHQVAIQSLLSRGWKVQIKGTFPDKCITLTRGEKDIRTKTTKDILELAYKTLQSYQLDTESPKPYFDDETIDIFSVIR